MPLVTPRDENRCWEDKTRRTKVQQTEDRKVLFFDVEIT